MRSGIAALAALIALAFVNYAIMAKERLLETGRTVFIELAPVDPRSLMQGDYMALRFKVGVDAASSITGARVSDKGPAPVPSDGRLVVALDARSIASYRRLDDGRSLAADEAVLRYRVRNGDVKFATNAYFFEEGTGARYSAARFGEFRVAPDGELLLTGLRGADLKPL
jgi:uncharacterized membrane-anchored protein